MHWWINNKIVITQQRLIATEDIKYELIQGL